ncbi:T9SS type A sorting domain-containing protein [Kaistella flava (ex Peng et al. 2021)]|uniref:T9SS type A sorting domain-containing protein n=1 Tax=Kaistella flava (ex Peng et al. 2021) TaxID=2038776 RepID=A0A7M2Y914_9FLAO|nr:Ig-like domain-containing protein [Kaistella flava (ex Peng et al. 2021)]QOW10586.1 T9SS type A sorting domain-containing protein [Kaistella flava (ex Peng et al. 2021)]
MKKTFLLFLFLPLFVLSQNTLVKWYSADLAPTKLESHITVSHISGSDGVSVSNNTDSGAANVFYSAGGWPKPNYNNPSNSAFDPTKYIQFTISPESDYKILLNSFQFNAKTQGSPSKMQVRYSKNADFSTYSVLQVEQSLSTNYTSFNLDFPANTIVNSKSTVYIRIYVYNTENNFHLEHNLSGTVGPSIAGVVSLENPIKPVANDDRVGTLKNTPVVIDLLSNDVYKTSGPLSSITITKSATHGVVKVNGLKDVTYTPSVGYEGFDSFYYTLTNIAGVSNTARVEVQTINGSEEVLVRWNKSDYTSTNKVAGVSGSQLNAEGEKLSLTNNASSTGGKVFTLSDLPNSQQFNGALDASKYLQASISTDAEHTAYIKSFNLSYKSQGGTGNMTIKYSKSADFSGEVFTIANNEPYNQAFTTKEFALSSGVVLYPKETLFVRIYTYNTYNLFFIDFKENGEVGPAFTGVVSSYAAEPLPCQTTVTWNGTSWVGGAPDLDKKAVISGNYDTAINGSFKACTLTVTNNAVLTVSSNTAVTVNNEIITNPGASFIVKSEANLIQKNDEALNTGSVTVERNANLKRLDYIYWASPVKGQELKKFSPGTLDNRFYVYNEGNDFFETFNLKGTVFGSNGTGFESAAKGYAIRASNNYPAGTSTADAPMQVFNGVFNGVPNNGVITFPLKYQTEVGGFVGGGYNLIGNPYPSNIDFDQLAKDNEDLIEGTAYFWTNLNPTPAMQGSGYPKDGSVNNYATLSISGPIPATFGLAKNVESKFPSNIVEVGQGFIVKAIKAGNLTFKNSYRTEKTDGVFFNKGTTEKQQSVRDRFWLQLTTPLDVVTTALIAYVDNATNGYEDGYDAQLLSVGSDALFTKVDQYKLGIQGRQYPLQTSDVVSVGASFYETGAYTLSISKSEGIFADGQNVYLKDKQTGMVINLSETAYTFQADKGLSEDRFEISYLPNATLGAATAVKENITVFKEGNDFVVQSNTQKITKLQVYDTAGRLLYSVQPNAKEAIINGESLLRGIYVLKIDANGTVVTKKIIK